MEEREMFYCNIPCLVKADLGNEYLIELDMAEYHEEYGFDGDSGFIENLPQTIFANKKYVSETKIDIESKTAFILREAETKAKDIIREAEKKSYDKIRKSDEELKSVQKRLLKVKGFTSYLDYLDGKTKYVLKSSRYGSQDVYDSTIMTMEELKKHEEYDRGNIRAYQFNTENKRLEVEICLMQYSDWSGSEKFKVQLFNTCDELKKHVLSEIEKSERVSYGVVGNLDKYTISHIKIGEAKKLEENNKEESRKQKREKLEKELKDLDS